MTDIDIGKKLEREKQLKEQEKLQEAAEENVDVSPDAETSSRSVAIIAVIIVGIFALLLGGFFAYNHFTAAAVVNVDELHEKNLEGNLEEEEGFVYNGFSFVKADGLWWTELVRLGGLLKVPLHFNPLEVESIPITGSLNPQFNEGEDVYIAIDPTITDKYYSLALSELSFNMAKGINRYPIGSCIAENPACENRTIISCEDPQNKSVVELVYGGEPKIELLDKCIKISGTDYDIVKAVDRVLYKWYGIMR